MNEYGLIQKYEISLQIILIIINILEKGHQLEADQRSS